MSLKICSLFRMLPMAKDFPDTHADFFPGNPQKGLKLSSERTSVRILQRSTGTDGERPAIRKICSKVIQDFLLTERLAHTEKGRHLKACPLEQEEVSGF